MPSFTLGMSATALDSSVSWSGPRRSRASNLARWVGHCQPDGGLRSGQQVCKVCQVSEMRAVGVQQVRDHLRDLIDAAVQRGEHTAISRHGQPVAVLVPYTWYVALRHGPTI